MSALLLFDELVAYTISADVETALVAIGHPEGEVVSNLPFMANMTAHYLEMLRGEDPKLFAEHFGPHGTDRAAIERMFALAESSYNNWAAARAMVPDAATIGVAEAKMWQHYLDAKAGVLSANAAP